MGGTLGHQVLICNSDLQFSQHYDFGNTVFLPSVIPLRHCKPCYRLVQAGRKVRTAQSNAPVNSRLPLRERESATENNHRLRKG